MKDVGATYDPSKNPFTPIEPGVYPAHITGLSEREVSTKAGDAIVLNLTYKVAEEAGNLVQLCYEMDGYNYVTDNNGNRIPVENGDGNQKSIKCTHLVGREFRDNGTFVFINSESSGKNKRYFNFLENVGIELNANEEGVTPLEIVEEEDVVGLPVFVKIGSEEYVTSDTKDLPEDQQEKRTAWKVFNVQRWQGGEKISASELEDDLPF